MRLELPTIGGSGAGDGAIPVGSGNPGEDGGTGVGCGIGVAVGVGAMEAGTSIQLLAPGERPVMAPTISS